MSPSFQPRTRPFRLALIGVIVALCATSASAETDLKELARKAKSSVVKLDVLDRFGNPLGSGSGFFVTQDGWIVTNHHVVAGADQVVANLADGTQLPIEGVLASQADDDLAVLRAPQTQAAALPLARSSLDLEIGEEIVVLGGPLGLAGTLSDGIIAAVRQEGDQALTQGSTFASSRLQITAAISPGSSGSPVMNLDGEVIGVVVSQVTVGQNLNFAVPVESLRQLLAGIDPQAEPRRLRSIRSADGGSGSVVRNLVISVVFFALLALGYLRWGRS